MSSKIKIRSKTVLRYITSQDDGITVEEAERWRRLHQNKPDRLRSNANRQKKALDLLKAKW